MTAREIPTLSKLFEGVAAEHRGRTAVIYGARSLTLEEIIAESRHVARGLVELGIAPGDRIALWMPNAPAYLALVLACARVGAVAVNINSRFRSAELADIVGRSGAKALVYWPEYRGIAFNEILAEVDSAAMRQLKAIVAYREDRQGHRAATPHGVRVIDYADFARLAPLNEDRATADSGVGIFTTSGTTRAPKFVLHTHRSIARHAEDVARAFGYGAPNAVTLQMLPFCGVFGFSQAMASLAVGAPVVLLPAFEAEAAAEAMVRHRVTHTNGSDDMFERLLAARGGACPYPHLAWAGFAAFNAAAEPLVIKAETRGVRLVGLYGTSELQALFARQPIEASAARRALAGGLPVSPEAAVRVRDPESQGLLAAGGAGELELKGPSMMAGYFGDAEASMRAITADGFIRTGDLGYMSDDGGFVFQSRLGDAIRLGGFLVNPIEIESYIQEHSNVALAQVVVVSHQGRNHPVAFVQPRAGGAIDQAALGDFCRQRMAKFKVPERFVAIAEFPVAVGPNGVKIQRGVLREMARRLFDVG